MAFLPDPRGLFLQAMLAVIFTKDFYFPFFLFAAYHYVILWATLGVGGEPETPEQYNFMVRMWFIFLQGAGAGWFVTWALGNPILVPIHSFDRWRPKIGVTLLTLSSFFVVRAFLIAIGRYNAKFPFPSGSETAHWVAFGIWVALIILVFIFSYVERIRTARFWRWFAITPRRSVATVEESSNGRLVTDFVVFLILLLLPQAIWDFGVIKWTGIANLNTRFGVTGGITLAVELIVWILGGVYFYRVHKIDDNWFSESKSLVTWRPFVVIVAVFSLLSGLAYLIAGLVLDPGIDNVNITITISLIVIALISLMIWLYYTMKIYNKRKKSPMKSNAEYTVVDGMSVADQLERMDKIH
jgi:hypothetical protein